MPKPKKPSVLSFLDLSMVLTFLVPIHSSGEDGCVNRRFRLLTPLSTQLAMLIEIFLGVILGLYDPLWHVEWPTKVHEGSGGVLDGLSAVGGALRGFQRPFSR